VGVDFLLGFHSNPQSHYDVGARGPDCWLFFYSVEANQDERGRSSVGWFHASASLPESLSVFGSSLNTALSFPPNDCYSAESLCRWCVFQRLGGWVVVQHYLGRAVACCAKSECRICRMPRWHGALSLETGDASTEVWEATACGWHIHCLGHISQLLIEASPLRLVNRVGQHTYGS